MPAGRQKQQSTKSYTDFIDHLNREKISLGNIDPSHQLIFLLTRSSLIDGVFPRRSASLFVAIATTNWVISERNPFLAVLSAARKMAAIKLLLVGSLRRHAHPRVVQR